MAYIPNIRIKTYSLIKIIEKTNKLTIINVLNHWKGRLFWHNLCLLLCLQTGVKSPQKGFPWENPTVGNSEPRNVPYLVKYEWQKLSLLV